MTHLRSLHATGPTDLLALVPRLLGFHPEDSVVVLTVGPADQSFHARADLPGGPGQTSDELADHLVRVALRGRVTRMALILYTHDAVAAADVGSVLACRLAAQGIDPVCVIRADGSHWWPLDRGGEAAGTPYDLGCHPLTAEGVLEGTVVLPSRQALADSLVGDDPREAAQVAALADAVVARLAHAVPREGTALSPHDLATEARWVVRRVGRFLVDGRRLEAHDLARLLTLLHLFTEIRDLAWAELTPSNAPGCVDLWRDAVRRAPAHLRAPPAVLLGFAAWLSGNGALAWCAVDTAEDADPGYGPAGVLMQTLAAAMAPSTWRPLPDTVRGVLDG